jgi:hypothetical protein
MSDKTVTVTRPSVVEVGVQAPKLIQNVVTAPKNVVIKVSKVGVQGFEGPKGQTVALLSSSNW